MQKPLLLLLVISLALSSCEKDDTTIPCEEQTPIIFLHGLLAAGDTYANQFMRFKANDYCDDRLYVTDRNTLAMGADLVTPLDAFIDQVLAATGASKVHLAGHSAGGGLGYSYLSDANRAAKVDRYIHIGSAPQAGPAGPNGEIPTLNIWSPQDEILEGSDIPGAVNAQILGADHYEVATNAAAFEAMYKFLNDDKAPNTTKLEPEGEIALSGKVLTLGENVAQIGASVRVYSIDQSTGERVTNSPLATFTTDANGLWGPYSAVADTKYEFQVTTGNTDDRPVSYFREGFIRSDDLVYLRTIPSGLSLAANLLSELPEDDDQSVLIVFSANKAVIEGRDELTVNGINLATPAFASADQTTIAFFLYDDGDGQTEEQVQGAFSNFLFLNGVDIFFPTTSPQSIPIEFNGRSLAVPNFKSDSEGIVIAVLN